MGYVSGPAETICNRARSTIFDRGHCTFLGHVVLVSKLGNFSSHSDGDGVRSRRWMPEVSLYPRTLYTGTYLCTDVSLGHYGGA